MPVAVQLMIDIAGAYSVGLFTDASISKCFQTAGTFSELSYRTN